MFVSAILFAVANQRSAGLLSLSPVMVILFGPGPIQLTWWAAAGWILAGALVGAAITRLLGFQAPTMPVEKRSAFFLVWYSMGGSYLMQTLALTPMLLIFASLGDVERGFELTVERVLFTLVGVAAAVLVALLLHRWERRRGAS